MYGPDKTLSVFEVTLTNNLVIIFDVLFCQQSGGQLFIAKNDYHDNKFHGANMEPTWVLSAQVGLM